MTYDYGDGKRIEFSGPEPLGADDLRILQGLVAMAGPNGLVLGGTQDRRRTAAPAVLEQVGGRHR
ncbi:hypothetical protein ECZU29_59590 [Escherichia coli]|nr:hypothetical protein ECZU29_59590 [Escherichia coli]